MCEICNEPGHRRDYYLDPSFAGFFSSDAIEACIKLVVANKSRSNHNKDDVSDDGDVDDNDSDGT